MSGFATLSALITNLKTAGNYSIIPFLKTTALADATKWESLFFNTGSPQAGATLTAGLGNAATCSSSSTGALPFQAPPAPKKSFLTKFSVSKPDSGGTSTNCLFLYDRLAHCRINIAQATGNFSPVIDGTARLAAASAGDPRSGGMIMVEVASASALGAANMVTFTLTYTNEAGTAGRVTASHCSQASYAAGTVFGGLATTGAAYNGRLFLHLAAYDTGCRSIETWTNSSGTQTGDITISIVKPIAFIGQFNRGTALELDQVLQYPNMINIPDTACLALCSCHGTSNAVSGVITLAQA